MRRCCFKPKCCDMCGTQFSPNSGRQIRCSSPCSREAHNNLKRDRQRTLRADTTYAEAEQERRRDRYRTDENYRAKKILEAKQRNDMRYARHKAALLERDGNICAWCGREMLGNTQIDHVVPLCRGGTNDLKNLQVLCETCNLQKGDKPMSEAPVFRNG